MKNQRVHILTSWWCTNNCVFCMDNKSDRSYITLEKAKNDLLNWLDYTKEVTFTSWEPTIHPKIIDIVALSKALWYETIQIISNWRKYKDINFLLDLIKAGVTDFIISIHWYNSLIHDSIVRKKWAFDEVLKWMINISKLKGEYNLVFNTNTTIIKSNSEEIYKTIYFLEKFPIDSLVLNPVIPQEEAIINYQDILIKYSFLAKEFLKLKDFQDKYKNIYINGFPYCLWEWLQDMIWFREPVYFEQNWINYTRHSENQPLAINGNLINWKTKREKCKTCKYFNECEGIWDSYISLFWWDEFLPIK